MRLPSAIRQVAALTCAATLAWEYVRAPSSFFNLFSIWTLFFHFIYFQLPLKSRALVWFHPLSFVGANVIPVSYGHLLMWKPSLETDRVEAWELPLRVIIGRSVLIHLLPVIFHALDITVNQAHLVHSYQSKPYKAMLVWCALSYALLGLIFELVCPENIELEGIGIEGDIDKSREYWHGNKMISLIASIFAFFILYSLVLRRAFKRLIVRSKSG